MTRKGNRGQDVVLVILALLHAEHDTRRKKLIDNESFCRIGHIELAFATWGKYLQRLFIGIAKPKLISHAQARYAVVHIGSMQFKFTVALQNLADMCQLSEVVVNTLYLDHHLTVVIDGQRLFLQTFCSDLNFWQLAYLGQYRVGSQSGLTLDGHHLQLRVHLGEEGCHQIVEPIKHAQRYHQGHSSHSNPYHRNAANDIDGMGRLLRKEITPCDVKGEVHFFKSSSIRSM